MLTMVREPADREGFRCSGEVCPPGSTTQFPSGLTVAHSWDPALFGEWGTAMGEEFAGKGANVQFGPGVNVARIANGGRSFEYLSGEDPYLGYVLVPTPLKKPLCRDIRLTGRL